MTSEKSKYVLLAIVVTFILGGLDWLIGHDLNFFVFYYLPVFFAAWFVGASGSVFIAVLCALVWYGADFLSGHIYPSDLYAVWNTMIRLVSFLTIGWAVSSLKRTLDREKETSEKLRRSLSEIKVLESFLPICAQCKKIRDENGVWEQLEVYIGEHANTKFSHSYCPECYKQALAEAGLSKKPERAK